MKVKIPIKLVPPLCGFIFMNVVTLFIMAINLEKNMNLIFGIYAIFQGTISVFLLQQIYPKYSLATIFICVSEVMHFGQAFLLGLNRYDLFNNLNEDLAGGLINYNKANIFAFTVQAFVVIGMLVTTTSKEKEYLTHFEKKFICSETAVFKLGVIAFIMGVIPTLLYNFGMVKLALQGVGYVGIREAVDIGGLLLLTIFFRPGILMMIIGSQHKKKRAKIIFILAMIYELLCMFSGNRMRQFVMIMVYIFIYYRLIGKFSKKKIIMVGVAGFLLLCFMRLISQYRLYGLGNMDLWSMFVNSISLEPIWELLGEQGSTLNIVALTFRDVPSYTSFKGGMTYLMGLITIFPNTGGWQGNLVNMVSTLPYLNSSLPLGDSYIAELYHNFGWLSMPFALLEGYLIGRVTFKIEKTILHCNWALLAGYLILFYKLIMLVRGFLCNILYDFIWTLVIILILKRFFIKENYLEKNHFKEQNRLGL